jgi:outer membrane protein assembly factor BamB
MLRSISALLVVVFVSNAFAADPAPWPQFRGPGGAGIAADQKPPTKLGPDTNLKWKVDCPPGASSPVIAGDRIFLTAHDGDKLVTIAYSRTDGKELWRKEAPAKAIEAYLKVEGSPAASTPVTDGERVVTYFGSCGLICYDLNGNQQWKYELPVAVTQNDFGTGSSPILVDGLVILQRDQKEDAKLLAVDVKTGSKVWETKRENNTAWGSACVWDTPGGKQIVVGGATKVKGYDLKNGQEKWSVGELPAVPCTTPVVADGKLIYAAWAPGTGGGGKDDFKMPTFDEILEAAGEKEKGFVTKAGAEKTFLKDFFDSNDPNKDGKITREEWDAMMKFLASGKNRGVAITPGGSGDVTKTHVAWSIEKGLPYVPSPLVYDGLMYCINMGGRLSVFDVKTGKTVIDMEDIGLKNVYASPVAANGHIYLCGLDKSVIVIKAGEIPQKVSSTKLDDRILATPAFADNVIYIRTNKTLYAFAEK